MAILEAGKPVYIQVLSKRPEDVPGHFIYVGTDPRNQWFGSEEYHLVQCVRADTNNLYVPGSYYCASFTRLASHSWALTRVPKAS